MDRLMSPTGSTPNLTNNANFSTLPPHWGSSVHIPYSQSYDPHARAFNTIGHSSLHHNCHPQWGPHNQYAYPPNSHPQHNVPSCSMSKLPTNSAYASYSSTSSQPTLGYIVAYTQEQVSSSTQVILRNNITGFILPSLTLFCL